MARFQTKITKARFAWGPFTGTQMAEIGEKTLGSIVRRIRSATTVDDLPAKPIGTSYANWKNKKGIAPVRNWISPIQWPKGRIKLMRAMKVLKANENRVVLGFIDPVSARIAHINNQQVRMWGISPTDQKVLVEAVNEAYTEKNMVFTVKVA